MQTLRKDPLKSSKLIKPKIKDYIKACIAQGIPREQAKRHYNVDLSPDAVFSNSGYVVLVFKREPHGLKGMTVWHLSIRRQDREAIHDWRVFQEIKNQICGPEIEALELYPKESRVLDTANQYHLYAIMGGEAIPLGYTAGVGRCDKPFLNSKQRPFE